MKCPFELPVYPIEFSKRVVIIRDQESTDILSVPKKYADYIVQAINSYEKYKELASDLRSGLNYLRETKAIPYGFGFDRLEKKLQAIKEAEKE